MNTLANALTETDLDHVCGATGAELHMINLQSMLSQRQTAIQLTTNLVRKMHDSSAAIINNIK